MAGHSPDIGENMNTIEFETKIHNGVVEIPTEHRAWQNKTVRVILLDAEESALADQLLRFSAASINTQNYHFNRDEANAR